MNQRPERIPSSLHGNFHLLLVLALGAWGCGDEHEEQVTCENFETPDVLELADVSPAEASSVENQDIVHTFTVLNASGTFREFTFVYGDEHEAGAMDPSTLKFRAMAVDENVVYTFDPVVWEQAGHVQIIEAGEYTDSQRCYILPRPLFSYDVTE